MLLSIYYHVQFVFLVVEDAAAVGVGVDVTVQVVTTDSLTLFAWQPMQLVKH